jgi:hypothetical protein
MKHADFIDVFNMVSKSVCTSIIEVSPDPLSPSTSQLQRLQRGEKKRRKKAVLY